MKIILSRLEDGSTEIQHSHTAKSLGFDEKNDLKNTVFSQPIETNVRIDKYSTQYILNVHFNTIVSLICDRCLCEFDKKLKSNFKLVYAVEQSELEQEEDAGNDYRVISAETHEIDISNDIKDSLLLLIPMKTLCSDSCKGLCYKCGIDLNKQKCNCDIEQIDPRWEALKKLNEKNNSIINN